MAFKKNVKLWFVLIWIVPLILMSNTNCEKCQFVGGYSKVVVDSLSGNYKIASIEMGTEMLSLQIDNCIYKNSYYSVSGLVNSRFEMELTKRVDIFLAKKNSKNEYERLTVLGTSNSKGEFTIQFEKRENDFIILEAKDGSGVLYHTVGFN